MSIDEAFLLLTTDDDDMYTHLFLPETKREEICQIC
jgi:hypothetical protein